jgi:hypothetical protein
LFGKTIIGLVYALNTTKYLYFAGEFPLHKDKFDKHNLTIRPALHPSPKVASGYTPPFNPGSLRLYPSPWKGGTPPFQAY